MKTEASPLHYLQPVRLTPGNESMFLDPDAPAVQQLRKDLLKALRNAAPGSVVPISFEHVEFSASCHAAVLGTALQEIILGECKGRFIVGIDPDGRNGWDADAALRKVSADLSKKLICVWRGPSGQAELVGPTDKQVQATYAFVTKKWKEADGATARDLAEAEGLTIQAASNRMTKAAALGIIYRANTEVISGGGTQHVYVPVQ